MIPKDKLKDYISYRRNFFANLVEYHKESNREELKSEIQASLDYLIYLEQEIQIFNNKINENLE